MITFENYYQDTYGPLGRNFKPKEAHVRRAMDNIIMFKELTEQAPYYFEWGYFKPERVQNEIRERLSDRSIITPVIDLARTRLFANDYFISLNTNNGPQWDMTIKYEHPHHTMTRLLTNGSFLTYSMLGIYNLMMPNEVHSVSFAILNVPREDRIMKKIGESTRDFRKARELADFGDATLGPNLELLSKNFPKLMDYAVSQGFPKWKAIKLKQKFGFPVDPSELDDKTLVDLL